MEDITATRIRERRIELGMTQEDLAILSGYNSRSTINKIEKDTRNMPIAKVVDIANALRVSPSYLMGWEDTPFGEDIDRNEKEETIISLFRLLSDEQKQLVTNLIESLAVKK